MPARRSSKRTLVPQARQALQQMKYEIANELNVPSQAVQSDYWGDVSARDCGSVGGNMVRRMIEAAQASLVATTSAGVKQGFSETIGARTGGTGYTPQQSSWNQQGTDVLNPEQISTSAFPGASV
ncbi:MAG: alpha/beta-type small acid-soluble spore protein [Clostridia bacterium]|nr:alpha/beta-type small acid-soluble spore protein [Clostridia bacterium]